MCLSSVTRRVAKPSKKEVRKGWKVFRLSAAGNLWGECYTHSSAERSGGYQTDRWYRCNNTEPAYGSKRHPYPRGFHILNYEPLRTTRLVVRQVEGRGILAEGTEGNVPIFVAREMRILKS